MNNDAGEYGHIDVKLNDPLFDQGRHAYLEALISDCTWDAKAHQVWHEEITAPQELLNCMIMGYFS